LNLLVHDLDLLVEHSTGEAIDRYVHPVMLLPFDDEIILQVVCVWLEVA
jgi:hypothetical protein